MAVGVIAAQSIGEPGTQLTMRTFHIGGTASHRTEQTTLEAKNTGLVKFHNVTTVKNKKGDLVVMNRSGALIIQDGKGRERERHAVVYGAKLKVKDGQDVKQGQLLVEWDPYSFTILTEEGGQASFRDVVEGQTLHEQVDENTGMSASVIMETSDEKKQPRIEIRDDKGKSQREYQLPRGAHINVQEAERVKAGEPLMDGPIDPHDILRVRGEKELQRYLVDEIQEVYRLQGVNINDKHIEVIVRQMMRWVKVE